MLATSFRTRNVTAVAVAAALVAVAAVQAFSSADAKPDGSGGKAVAHYAGGKIIRKGPAAAAAPEAMLYQTGVNALEPTLGLDSDGDVFFVGVPALGASIMRSQDNGKTWEDKSPKLAGVANAHPVTLDPYVYVDDRTDRVYTIDLTVACSYMSYSDDKGESWITNPLACGRPVNDHQTLFAGPPAVSPTAGYDNVVYYCWNDVATSSCSKSLNGGLTWNPTGEPAFHPAEVQEGSPGTRNCGGLHGHGVVGDDGTVYLPKEHCEEPWLAMSRDEGLTWEHVRVAHRGRAGTAIWGPDPSVAVDSKGNVYYAWVGRDRLPRLAVSDDGGYSWSKPMEIGFPGLTEVALATVDAGGPGKVAIAYYGTDDVSGKIEDRKYDDAKWNFYMTMSANVFDRKPVFYSGPMNDPRDPVAVRECGPRRCYDALDFIDVVVGPDGTPWTSFVDNCIAPCAPEGLPVAPTNGVVGRFVGGPSLK
ncbi:MAG TPA: sialidase family protein [Actinomycetota bacterium]|nr:sialidase family protein [Actinomycetota bacterium]